MAIFEEFKNGSQW